MADLLIGVILGMVEPLLAVLPRSTLPTLLPPAQDLGQLIATWDAVVPIRGPLALLLVYLAAMGTYLAVRVAVWFWNLLPFT